MLLLALCACKALSVLATWCATAATAPNKCLSAAAAVVAATSAAANERLGVPATTTAAAVLLSLLVALATAAVRPRTSRGCDRERGYAGCEKHPGHDRNLLSNGKNGPLAAPFQPLNGWNLHPIAQA
jgi:hypothetical protein